MVMAATVLAGNTAAAQEEEPGLPVRGLKTAKKKTKSEKARWREAKRRGFLDKSGSEKRAWKKEAVEWKENFRRLPESEKKAAIAKKRAELKLWREQRMARMTEDEL